MTIKTLVLTGEGINCEVETASAFEQAGAQATIMHLSDFLQLENFNDFDILAFPGGFSFGDEIRSGKIVAELINLHQQKNLEDFINSNKPVIGICNGFQILVQLNVFNDFKTKTITLSENINEKFINKWVHLGTANTNSLWLKNIPQELYMPIRHKEGRITGSIPKEQIAFQYTDDINGSWENIAGLTNQKGNVLGLMPHPEAALFEFLLPDNKNKYQDNRQIFKNAVDYVKRIKK